ncbi:MAG: class I SAM-dependent methyltransferase [Candidatus Bathyarchaeia archaeon]|jgi:ubiquinone/menaquinone biosynthesis C-methylase UbiE
MVALEEFEQARKFFLQYTKEAFLKLPKMVNQKILDIGCGSGLPTIEIAKLCEGEVTGIDIDESAIAQFRKRINKEGLSNRVRAINSSLTEMEFCDESFDVIWSEGVLEGLTFDYELKSWRRLLKQNGFLVIHYEILGAKESIFKLSEYGYVLTETVLVPADAWWTKFYKPLAEKMCKLLEKYKKEPEALKLLKMLQTEIDMVKKNPSRFNTAFYIMKKT